MEVLGEFGLAQTFFVPLIDRGTLDFESTPVTFAAGDVTLSIDAGAFANIGTLPSHEGNGIYSFPLTAAETAGTRIVVVLIDQSSPKLWEDQAVILSTTLGGQIAASKSIIVGQVHAGGTAPSTTQVEATRIAPNVTEEATADHFIGTLIKFMSGAALGEISDVTDYAIANAREFYTYTAIVTTPSAGDLFIII